MGHLTEDGWVTGRRGEVRAQLKNAAKDRMRQAHRPDRPTEAAAGEGSDPTRRAARMFAGLAQGDTDPKTISNALHLDRRGLGHDDNDSASTSRLNASMVEELATEVDDGIEAAHGQEAEEDLEGFDAWLEQKHGMTGEELEAQLQELDDETRDALVEQLNNDYEHDPDGEGGYGEGLDPFDWLHENYGVTREQFVAHLEGLAEGDRDELLGQLAAEFQQAAGGPEAEGAGVGEGASE